MSDMSDADFASYVDRIMACRDAEDAAKADTKLVYAAAADAGIDKTALGLFVRVERMDQTQVIKANRKDELTEEYRARYRRGKASHVRVREADFEVTTPNTSVPAGFDPETGEEVTAQELTIGNADSHSEPRNPAPQESAQMQENSAELDAVDASLASAAGQEGIVDRQPIQPETANDIHERASTNDKASSEAGPQAETSLAGTGSEMLADREARHEGQAASAGLPTLYAEPGIVTREQNGREPMVAHPYATCWPVNTIDVSDGVQKPIVKIGGLILDGRGRYLAARKVHTSPNSTLEYPTVQYDGDDDLADSIRWNLESRPNMSEAALRIVAQKLAKLAPERADEILERMGLAQVSEAAE